MFTCFGYGSLVNAATLSETTEVAPARLKGWRRAWRHSGVTPYGQRCTLTVVPDADCEIWGVVVAIPLEERPHLDRREAQYEAVLLSPGDVTWTAGRPEAWPDPHLWVGHAEYGRAGDADFPVMLSYLDVVLAGFFAEFGEAGVSHFLETTADWHVPILDDRAKPRYPRALLLSDADRAMVDGAIRAAGATKIGL
ncbi:gamma-glutamylcyclotransferase family protein [Afifella sp. IM 167]|uniref:gamma-glutamylcyclotransferase family protein n=1 Tax=Afifella sp. IM 167 TaxID=2033586 RepID=UPI001CCFB516|nr:gamma-glutamylcyclotransferase family protein [Afifella sp. IM 167]MBZ8134186.1 gamma-glutamylcyclotransferase [Afifella sp. IM 167]